ncbi:hypothetical protein [Calothrix sp. UHCC 0171]|nr:hypothetical protein [Calothrix sp. UHCC 0171]MEA5570135.1 hypothetical protein [Calothrix sp. UHCC 0171]
MLSRIYKSQSCWILIRDRSHGCVCSFASIAATEIDYLSLGFKFHLQVRT